jgi:hypothetical protein
MEKWSWKNMVTILFPGRKGGIFPANRDPGAPGGDPGAPNRF